LLRAGDRSRAESSRGEKEMSTAAAGNRADFLIVGAGIAGASVA